MSHCHLRDKQRRQMYSDVIHKLCVLLRVGTTFSMILCFRHSPDWMTGDICRFVDGRVGCDLYLSRSSVETGVIKWFWFHPSWTHNKKEIFEPILKETQHFIISTPRLETTSPFYKWCAGLCTATMCSGPELLLLLPSSSTWVREKKKEKKKKKKKQSQAPRVGGLNPVEGLCVRSSFPHLLPMYCGFPLKYAVTWTGLVEIVWRPDR